MSINVRVNIKCNPQTGIELFNSIDMFLGMNYGIIPYDYSVLSPIVEQVERSTKKKDLYILISGEKTLLHEKKDQLLKLINSYPDQFCVIRGKVYEQETENDVVVVAFDLQSLKNTSKHVRCKVHPRTL